MSRPLRLIIFAGIVLVLFYFVKDTLFNDDNYIKPLLQERQNKELSFRSRENSPFTEDGRRAFKGLTYYEPNLAYRVKAQLQAIPKQDTVQMKMNNGTSEPYLRYATATFELEGQPQRLTLFKRLSGEKQEELFVPFTDKTNGFETYGGGRFLDVAYREDAKTIQLDFNRAYSPYCNYNPDYVCPVPPQDNRLAVAVPAGEKTYEGAH
ncbi:DUF1684 domain-containing protein [Pontibacter liquoris]|uniref:DUF1684 domain-containing protein n=1 Tax=Pontibacter liquoris TaxID=2905677 RepID=UPI001FA7598B|nr:DUF1684 domain-containing protein [Pontibacter liquoris]